MNSQGGKKKKRIKVVESDDDLSVMGGLSDEADDISVDIKDSAEEGEWDYGSDSSGEESSTLMI